MDPCQLHLDCSAMALVIKADHSNDMIAFNYVQTYQKHMPQFIQVTYLYLYVVYSINVTCCGGEMKIGSIQSVETIKKTFHPAGRSSCKILEQDRSLEKVSIMVKLSAHCHEVSSEYLSMSQGSTASRGYSTPRMST